MSGAEAFWGAAAGSQGAAWGVGGGQGPPALHGEVLYALYERLYRRRGFLYSLHTLQENHHIFLSFLYASFDKINQMAYSD